MRTLYYCAVVALLVPRAWSGEILVFKDARKPVPEALRHVAVKGVVTEFLDPQSAGLGKSLALMLWRETLTAIADQASTGVIVAERDEPFVNDLPNDYHKAAVKIATSQNARLCLWGAVEEDRGELLVETYLAVLTERGGSDLELKISAGEGPEEGRLVASLGRTRFNLSPQHTSRSEMFDRPLILELNGAVLREGPSSGAPAVESLAKGSVLWATDMVRDGWYAIRRSDGGGAFLDARTRGLRVPPRYVEASAQGVNLRAGAGKSKAVVLRRDLEGSYRVLDHRFAEGNWWYRIAVGEKDGWVAGHLVRARYSLPAIHLLAGLYRYYGNNYSQAARELEQFIDSGGESNANRAAVAQVLGASRLLAGDPGGAWATLTKAIEWTPYDPRAYLARSVAGLGLRRPEEAVMDLSKALTLNPRDGDARALAEGVWTIANAKEGVVSAHAMAEKTGLKYVLPQMEEMLGMYDIKPPN